MGDSHKLPLLELNEAEKLEAAPFVEFARHVAKDNAKHQDSAPQPEEVFVDGEDSHIRKLLESIESSSSQKAKGLEKITANDLRLLHQFIEHMDLALLIKLSIQNPTVNTLCNHPSLNDFWNEKWRTCGRNPREQAQINHDPIHEYLPQPTINTFEFIKGLFVYSQYILLSRSSLKNQESSEQYLRLAAELNYFPALNALCARALKKNETVKAILYAQVAAQYYWTPGYLLLTSIYYSLKLYPEALQTLMISEKLLPFSNEMVNNAYQGKTLERILEPLMAELKVSSWNETLRLMAERANFPRVSLIPDSFFNITRRTVAELTKVQQDSSPKPKPEAGEAEQSAGAEQFRP
jgi:hypothetical protein